MDNIILLKSLGFTEYEARVYVALSDLGAATARELSQYSKLPRNKTYDTLKKLEQKGRLQSLPISPRKYKLLNINQLKVEIESKKKSLSLLEENINRFVEESSKPKIKEYREIFWVIRSKKAIMEKMKSQNMITKKEMLSLNRLSHASADNLKNIRKGVREGLKIKMLVPFTEENMKRVRKWQEAGAKVRNYDQEKFGPLGTRFGVFDKNVARITFGKPDVLKEEDYITLWAESPYLANMLRNYFFTIWKKSK